MGQPGVPLHMIGQPAPVTLGSQLGAPGTSQGAHPPPSPVQPMTQTPTSGTPPTHMYYSQPHGAMIAVPGLSTPPQQQSVPPPHHLVALQHQLNHAAYQLTGGPYQPMAVPSASVAGGGLMHLTAPPAALQHLPQHVILQPAQSLPSQPLPPHMHHLLAQGALSNPGVSGELWSTLTVVRCTYVE
jgi:hypothetical protein